MVKEITTIEEFKAAIGDSNTGLVVIDFWAEWCGPCTRFHNKYEMLSKKYPQVNFYKLNTDNQNTVSIVDACMIAGLPSFVFFKGGIYFNKVVGANESNLEKMILENLNDSAVKSNP